MTEKYSEETAMRYIEGNDQTDKLADLVYELPEIKIPKLNKYQNKYLLTSTRQKKSKKENKDAVINSRVRTTVKNKIRTKCSEEVWSKE